VKLEHSVLRYDDYPKVLQFIESIQIANNDFAMHILGLLSNIFGYNKANFWLDDGKGNLFYPISTIGDNFICDYLDENYKDDLLHPQNVGIDYAISKKAIHINHILPPDYFEKTPYYQFLNKYGQHIEFNTYLTNVGNLIGNIAILRSKDENEIKTSDMNILKILSNYISQGLYTNQLYLKKDYENKIFEAFANNSSTGLILCDLSLKIHYCNKSALEISRELLAGEKYHNPTQHLLENILFEHREIWRLGYESVFYTATLKQVKINILPTIMGDCGLKVKDLYMIMLSYEKSQAKNNLNHFFEQGPAPKLTVRERQILNLIVLGKTNQEISTELYISIHTVKKYLRNLFDKFNVKNRTSLIYKVTNK